MIFALKLDIHLTYSTGRRLHFMRIISPSARRDTNYERWRGSRSPRLGCYLSLFRHRRARLDGVAARSIVIPLDYRPGTELASFHQYHPLLSVSLPLFPSPAPLHSPTHTLLSPLSLFSLCRSLFLCSRYLTRSSAFRCILFYAYEPCPSHRPPSRPSALFLHGGTTSWLVRRVRGSLLFLI